MKTNIGGFIIECTPEELADFYKSLIKMVEFKKKKR